VQALKHLLCFAFARLAGREKMTGGEALAVGSGGGGGSITFAVAMSCLTAASGGLLLGYDISVTGQSLPVLYVLC
jgi:hypothetical protein